MNPMRELTDFRSRLLLEGEGEGAGGGGDGAGGDGTPPPAGGGTGGGSLFKPDQAKPGEGGDPPQKGDVPDWIYDQYKTAENPVEAQAKAYTEALKKVTQRREEVKTEVEKELRESVTAEIRKELEGEFKIEAPDGYAYPEGVDAPAEEIDGAFRAWAHKNRVGQEAFNELVALYGQTLPDPAAELAKLGDKADARIAAMNNWGSKHIPVEHHPAAMKIMQTAEGFELFEALMQRSLDRGFSPEGGDPPPPMDREALRKMQNDPRYWDPAKREEAYVRQVDQAWERFAARQAKP